MKLMEGLPSSIRGWKDRYFFLSVEIIGRDSLRKVMTKSGFGGRGGLLCHLVCVTSTHTHTYIYIYIFLSCVEVCSF